MWLPISFEETASLGASYWSSFLSMLPKYWDRYTLCGRARGIPIDHDNFSLELLPRWCWPFYHKVLSREAQLEPRKRRLSLTSSGLQGEIELLRWNFERQDIVSWGEQRWLMGPVLLAGDVVFINDPDMLDWAGTEAVFMRVWLILIAVVGRFWWVPCSIIYLHSPWSRLAVRLRGCIRLAHILGKKDMIIIKIP